MEINSINFFIENYNNIFNLCKNCSTNQIINYINNFEDKCELKKILQTEDVFGNTPFNIIFKNNNISLELIKFFINDIDINILNKSNKFKLYPINYAIEFLDDNNITKFLLNICEIDIKDINNNNLFHHILLLNKNNIDLLMHIKNLNMNINFDQKNKLGYTPLLLACNSKNVETINFLLSINHDINIKNANNNTCLMFLCMNNNFSIIKKIVNSNNINLLDNQNDNALSYACGCDIKDNCNLEIIQFLVEKGCNFKNINKENNSLLIYASGAFTSYYDFKIDINVIKYLINLGVDINIKNNFNKTFLDYIILRDINIFKILLNEDLVSIPNNLKLKYNYLFDLGLDIINIEYIKNNNQDSCIICFDNFENNDELLICHNNHFYHKDCLVNWFKSNNFNLKCPTCKDDFNFTDKIIKY